MALSKTTSVKGVNIPSAYFKVEYVAGNKDGISAEVSIKANKDASPISKFVLQLNKDELFHNGGTSDRNYISQVYAVLKSKPITEAGINLTDAIDV